MKRSYDYVAESINNEDKEETSTVEYGQIFEPLRYDSDSDQDYDSTCREWIASDTAPIAHRLFDNNDRWDLIGGKLDALSVMDPVYLASYATFADAFYYAEPDLKGLEIPGDLDWWIEAPCPYYSIGLLNNLSVVDLENDAIVSLSRCWKHASFYSCNCYYRAFFDPDPEHNLSTVMRMVRYGSDDKPYMIQSGKKCIVVIRMC